MSDLMDKVVLVSGGTPGMGAAVARAAVDVGATVAVTGRREDVGTAFAAELEDRGRRPAAYVAADVADVGQAQASVQEVVRRFGRIDCLVNAAGLTSRGTLLDTTPEHFDQHVAVNLRAPFVLMQAAVRDMVRRRAPGTIVNIITMSSHGGQPHLAPYVAAKAGLVGLTRSLSRRLAPDVLVNAVAPGLIDTRMAADTIAERGEACQWRIVSGTGRTASWPASGSRMMPEKKPDAALFGFPGRTTMDGRRMPTPSRIPLRV